MLFPQHSHVLDCPSPLYFPPSVTQLRLDRRPHRINSQYGPLRKLQRFELRPPWPPQLAHMSVVTLAGTPCFQKYPRVAAFPAPSANCSQSSGCNVAPTGNPEMSPSGKLRRDRFTTRPPVCVQVHGSSGSPAGAIGFDISAMIRVIVDQVARGRGLLAQIPRPCSRSRPA